MKTYFNWSSGKDCALAYYQLKQQTKVDLLLTSINSHHDRVSMHGLRREVLINQIEKIGLPFSTIELPEQPSMEEYNSVLLQKVEELKTDNFTHAAFGDIFLEDLRNYRENQLKEHGIECIFPLWKRDTKEIIQEFIRLGFKAVVVCLNSALLDESFLGRVIDEQFIYDLPENVDPCGENGEFHTFCFDGPIFSNPVDYTIGEKIFREYKNPKNDDSVCAAENVGFWFCDILLNED